MKISIVVPCFNGKLFLESALESILENSAGLDVELIVQDGGSTDGSVELARKLAGEKNVFVENDTGQEDAVSRGWQRSSGEILAWLNADDYFEAGALQAIHTTFVNHPESRWCIGHFRIIDEEGKEIRKIHRRYKNFLLRHYSRNLLLVENMIPQMSVFIRRDLWQEVGNLKCGMYGAFDYDYWLRLSAVADPLILAQTLAAFRWHPASKTGRDVGRLFREELEICKNHTRNPILVGLHQLVYWRNLFFYNLAKW